MLSSKEISMLIEATGTSVYMTLASTLMAYVCLLYTSPSPRD